MNIPYEGTSASRKYEDFNDNEVVYLELGPSTNPNVTLTFVNISSVTDATGPWSGGARTFTTPDDDPLEVTLSNAAGQKKIFLKVRPPAGLPGGSPV
jgi:hypothetical protein